MTAFIVAFSIILVFAFFLNMKIKAEISYLGGIFDLKVKYLCFTVFPLKEKKKKGKKRKNKKKKNKSLENIQTDNEIGEDVQKDTQEVTEQPDEENTDKVNSENASEDKTADEKKKKNNEPISKKIDKIVDIFEKVRIIWSVSKKWLAHIFKHIYIENLMIDFLITDEDACNAAVNYGKINAAVYNLLNFIRTFFTVTIKTVDIICDFDAEKSVYDISAKVTVRPATILCAAFGILFGLLINIKKLIGKNNKEQSSNKKVVSM